MKMATKKFNINNIGCFGEGSRGIYLGEHVMQIAESCGMDIVPIGPNRPDDCDATDDQWSDMYTDYTDEALEWLNTNMVEPDVLFDFVDGEFYLLSNN